MFSSSKKKVVHIDFLIRLKKPFPRAAVQENTVGREERGEKNKESMNGKRTARCTKNT